MIYSGSEQDSAGLRVKCKRRIETVDEICDRMRKHVVSKHSFDVPLKENARSM